MIIQLIPATDPRLWFLVHETDDRRLLRTLSSALPTELWNGISTRPFLIPWQVFPRILEVDF